MLHSLIGSEDRLKILLHLVQTKKSYLTEMENALGIRLFAVQTQVKNLESDGIVQGWSEGHRRFFGIDPAYPLRKELLALLRKALTLGIENGSRPGRRKARGRKKVAVKAVNGKSVNGKANGKAVKSAKTAKKK